MNFDFSSEQRAFAQSLERKLAQVCPRSAVRDAIAAGTGRHEPTWRALADLGALGCAIPEDYGGHGFGALELALAAEQIGSALAPVPANASIYAFALTMLHEGSAQQTATWLPAITRGEIVGTFHFGTGLRARSCKISGRASPVPDGVDATVAIVLCDDESGRSLYLTELRHASRRALDGLDPSKPLAELTFDGVDAEPLGQNGAGDAAAQRAIQRAVTLLAFEQIGGAHAALMTARDYALERRTFGRAIGSYQAVKHKLADAWVRIELARVHAYYAAWALATEAPDFPLASAAARASATEAFLVAARESLHVHGGIGFTWDADCHLFYRRARALAAVFGSAAQWRECLAERIARGERAMK